MVVYYVVLFLTSIMACAWPPSNSTYWRLYVTRMCRWSVLFMSSFVHVFFPFIGVRDCVARVYCCECVCMSYAYAVCVLNGEYVVFVCVCIPV